MCFVGMSVNASDVRGAARIAYRVHAELVFATGSAERSEVSLAISAVHGPVIVAMMVHVTMAVEKQSVLTVFEGQCTVRAKEETVTGLGMGVRMDTIWIWTRWCAQKSTCLHGGQKSRQGQ